MFKCIERKTLEHFSLLSEMIDSGDNNNKLLIKDSECFGNGKTIANWAVDMINTKYPEIVAKRKIDDPLNFYIDKLFDRRSNAGHIIKINLI